MTVKGRILATEVNIMVVMERSMVIIVNGIVTKMSMKWIFRQGFIHHCSDWEGGGRKVADWEGGGGRVTD